MSLCNPNLGRPRLFYLYRHNDVSKTSGTGVVADGVLFPNSMVSLCFRSQRRSIANWESIEDLKEVHGHNGDTVLVWEEAET